MGNKTHITALLLAATLSGPAFAEDPIEPAAIEALHAMGAHPSTAHHKPPPHAGSHAKPHPPSGHKPPPPRHDAHHRPPPPRHHDDHHDDHHDHHDHHHPRGPYWPGYWHDNDDDILWGAATALAIGSIIRSTPSGCSDVQVGNHMYKHCGNTWLQAAYSGHQLVYVAVSDPR